MLKWTDTAVTFRELPDEITLCINISGCPNRCPDCHSKYLWEDSGEPLLEKSLNELICRNSGITAVCFMGGDNDPAAVNALAASVDRTLYRIGWYSGRSEIPECVDIRNFDYVKLGPYMKEFGPIDANTTNQRLYAVRNGVLEDITFKIQEKNYGR